MRIVISSNLISSLIISSFTIYPDAIIAVVSVTEELIALSNGVFPYCSAAPQGDCAGEAGGGSMISILRVFRLTRIGRAMRMIGHVKAFDKMLKVRWVTGHGSWVMEELWVSLPRPSLSLFLSLSLPPPLTAHFS